ncbi:PAS domain S-box protein [Seonamhaeicola algicola]|uniref:histidine kinase n=1 Tax=Seonamhaeicola algicola TaxID=1719036 RepID=A0A5C7B7V2_9FLAO|nr:PAS domain S-box protein [Seonamhaeicola algicola]TXE13932.1 PAS domain S-box protein [Seonamhaeicola algicola]
MINAQRKIRKGAILFIITKILVLIVVLLIVDGNINERKNDNALISQANNQITLSKNIVQNLTALQETNNLEVLKNIAELLRKFKSNQNYLSGKISTNKYNVSDSLFQLSKPYFNTIVASTNNVINYPNTSVITTSLNDINIANNNYVPLTVKLSQRLEQQASNNLNHLMRTVWFLAIMSGVVIIGCFFLILGPAFRQLVKKNKALINANKEIAFTKQKIKGNLSEVSKLKTDIEIQERFNKILIEQAPTSIAMLDTNMVYLAVSQRWIKDYKKEGQTIIGKSHYDVFPEIGDDWKQKHKECLNGAIDVCDEAPFIRADGTVQWIFWEVRPWFKADGTIGGLIMYTGDITEERRQRLEKKRAEEIVESTNKVAKIGAWELDLVKKTVYWSKMVCEIHEVPENYVPELETAINFYKEGKSRDTITEVVNKTIESGEPFDLQLEIITKKGNLKWVRTIGQAEFKMGECVRVYGVFQDVTKSKAIEQELVRKNEFLNFAEEIALLGYYHWNVKNDTVKCSKTLMKIFGINENISELNYQTYFNHVHPKDKEKVATIVRKTIENRKFHDNFIHKIITSNGQTKTVHMLGKVITNEMGEVVEILGTCQDITLQRMAEIKFRGLLESAPDAMIIVNDQGLIQIINKQTEKMFGYSPGELINKPVEVLIPKRYSKKHKLHTEGFFTNPKSINLLERSEFYGIDKYGKEFPVQLSLSPLQTEEGLLVSAALRDITAEKQAEARILKSKENLEVLADKLGKQNTQLADFVQITSHNLRAPVSNLNALLDLYNTAEDDDEKHMLFGKFERVINHLTLTLNTLVEALKTKNDKATVKNVFFDEILNRTKEVLAAQIAEKNVIITDDFSQVNKISYNKIYLESIFLNLVENAIKYSARNKTPEIHVNSEVVDGNVILKFKDNGLGIDLKKHGHKLFKLNKVFHRHPNAKGVGLFMTKVQIETMGGSISATSAVNEGTTFIINF